MNPPLVTIRDLYVRLGGKDILRAVNADLPRGSITALIGLNGAGKSTLLRALLQEVPYRGSIRFHCGHDHRRPAPEHVGYVPQKLRVDGNLPLTVLDLFGLTLRRRPLFFGAGRRLRARVLPLLAGVGAGGLIEQRVADLSGGELQRVLLALALAPHPELLLLDEPAAGIDFKDVVPLYDLIAGLNRRTGVTILLVSHELSMVSRMADHVLCLQDGRIQCEGPPREMINSDVLARTFGADKAFYPHAH
jgi:zinc transport system ATP-binding protein